MNGAYPGKSSSATLRVLFIVVVKTILAVIKVPVVVVVEVITVIKSVNVILDQIEILQTTVVS